MRKLVKRCKEEGIICRELRRSTVDLQLALGKMREQHKIAQECRYGYMASFAGMDAEECAWELKAKLEQLRSELADTCCKCKGWNDFIGGLLVEAEMFIARQAFAEAEESYAESVGPEKYAEMFYE